MLPPGERRLRAMVTARAAAELYFLADSTERRRGLTDEAIDMARELDDDATLSYVLVAAHWGMFGPGTAVDRETLGREMLSLAQSSGDRHLEVVARGWLCADLFEIGDVEGASEQSARELALADELRVPDLRWAALVHEACAALFAGRLDEADELSSRARRGSAGPNTQRHADVRRRADGAAAGTGRPRGADSVGCRRRRGVPAYPRVASRSRLHIPRTRLRCRGT